LISAPRSLRRPFGMCVERKQLMFVQGDAAHRTAMGKDQKGACIVVVITVVIFV
jgi:hypothetical protein